MLNSSGTKTKEYEYNAFGKVDNESNISTSNPWQYCGEYKDSETGLIYLRNRYYDPETGRFINEDPIRSGGNWYSYASQNPVMFIDLLGLTTMSKTDEDAIKNYQNQYNAAKEKNDYVGMNKAHVGAVSIYEKYDTNYKDNFDYTHGGKIFNYKYTYQEYQITHHDGSGEFVTVVGNVYILNLEGSKEQQEQIANNQSIGSNDFVVIDYRDSDNPNMQIRNSYTAYSDTVR